MERVGAEWSRLRVFWVDLGKAGPASLLTLKIFLLPFSSLGAPSGLALPKEAEANVQAKCP